jgi:hypothetical protein
MLHFLYATAITLIISEISFSILTPLFSPLLQSQPYDDASSDASRPPFSFTPADAILTLPPIYAAFFASCRHCLISADAAALLLFAFLPLQHYFQTLSPLSAPYAALPRRRDTGAITPPTLMPLSLPLFSAS